MSVPLGIVDMGDPSDLASAGDPLRLIGVSVGGGVGVTNDSSDLGMDVGDLLDSVSVGVGLGSEPRGDGVVALVGAWWRVTFSSESWGSAALVVELCKSGPLNSL